MTCTHCGTEIAAKALICYRCGLAMSEPRVKPPQSTSVFEAPRRSRRPLVATVAGAVAAAILAWLMFGS
jgi:hypothetical protein